MVSLGYKETERGDVYAEKIKRRKTYVFSN